MSDLISRQAAIDDLREYKVGPSHFCDESEIECFNDGIDTAISVLATLPSAERLGRWEDVEHAQNGLLYATCSVCGKRQTIEATNYCGNCGADMRGKENE